METELLEILNSSELTVGTKQVLKGIDNGTVRCVIVADDADEFILSAIRAAVKAKKVKLMHCPSKLELGKASGIEVGTAAVGVR